MDITKGQIGPEGNYGVTFEDGKARVELAYQGAAATAGMFVEISAIDMVQAMIDSTDTTLDNTLLDPVLDALRTK